MPFGEICSRDVVCAKRDATVKTAARPMREYHVGSIVVVDELSLLAEEMSAVASMVAGERKREAALRKVMA